MSGIRPSVRLYDLAWATAAKFAAATRTAGDIDRLLHGTQQRGVRRKNATLSATYD